MLIMHIGHISRTQSFQHNRHINFHALVALKLLVSLISRLVACSARIVVDRQTDRHRPTTVTLAAHARRGLMKITHVTFTSFPDTSKLFVIVCTFQLCLCVCSTLLSCPPPPPVKKYYNVMQLRASQHFCSNLIGLLKFCSRTKPYIGLTPDPLAFRAVGSGYAKLIHDLQYDSDQNAVMQGVFNFRSICPSSCS